VSKCQGAAVTIKYRTYTVVAIIIASPTLGMVFVNLYQLTQLFKSRLTVFLFSVGYINI